MYCVVLCCLVCIALCCAVLCCIASPHCCWSPRNLPNKRQTLQQTSFLQTLPLPALRPYMSPFPRLILYSHLVKPFGAEPLTFFFLLYLFASLPANSFPSGHLTGAQAVLKEGEPAGPSPEDSSSSAFMLHLHLVNPSIVILLTADHPSFLIVCLPH